MKSLKYNGPRNAGTWAAALGQLALDVVSTENGQAGVGEMKARMEIILASLTAVLDVTDRAHRPAAEALKDAVRVLAQLSAKLPEEKIGKALTEGRAEISKALQALRK
jgi:hypothetical protein